MCWLQQIDEEGHKLEEEVHSEGDLDNEGEDANEHMLLIRPTARLWQEMQCSLSGQRTV